MNLDVTSPFILQIIETLVEKAIKKKTGAVVNISFGDLHAEFDGRDIIVDGNVHFTAERDDAALLLGKTDIWKE